ncbi:uncharacterized protein LOC127263029 [Andrographis paniculata]|uniref:uncharacterized protein LOC127263029 n=1 Tax=Andrographis paniculata TaxID=175694 RepID=UPI0021E8F373|nr:uncharacterized protein LOC127263029 [Andrographis paniculata]
MATSMSSFRAPIISSAAPPTPRNRKNPTISDKSSAWWAPIFGWPSEPDYFDNNVKIEPGKTISGHSEKESGRIASDKKPFRGCLTAEKAKELRRKTIETYNFHDVMYHSAIASRLASDVSERRDL